MDEALNIIRIAPIATHVNQQSTSTEPIPELEGRFLLTSHNLLETDHSFFSLSSPCKEDIAIEPSMLLMTSKDHDLTNLADHTNEPLPEAIRDQARGLLVEAKQDLALLERERDRVQSHLDAIQSKCRQTKVKIEQYRMAIALHRKLPNQLLSQIFVECLPERVEVPWTLDKPPWTLGRVCSRWRKVVLSSPSLWCNIQVGYAAFDDQQWLSKVSPTPLCVIFSMTKEVIRRSGSLPISLWVASHSNPCAGHDPCVVAELVVPNIGRIRDLSLTGFFAEILTFLSLPAGLVEALETVRLSCTKFRFKPDHTQPPSAALSVLDSARNLRSLAFDFRVDTSYSLFRLPLHHLTYIEAPNADLDLNHAFSVLGHCGALAGCTLGIGSEHGAQWGAGVYDDTILFPVLSSLNLRIGSAPNFFTAFHKLSLPSLTDFTLSLCGRKPGEYSSRWDSVCTSIVTQSGRLQSLTLNFALPDAELEALLSAAPSLSVLKTPEVEFPTSILQKMACGELVPRLRMLACKVKSIDDACLEPYLNMLESRRLDTIPAAHIANVQFFNSQGIARYPSHLRKLCADGWNIRFEIV